MFRSVRALLCGSGVLIFSLAGQAQSSRPDPYYSQRGGYEDRRNQDSLVGRVLSDLDGAAYNARLDDHERKHFDEAARNLQEFEERWAQGKFDNGKLDKAIENLQHLADADRVRGRDRDLLARDLRDLRQFRSNRGRYARGGYDPRWR